MLPVETQPRALLGFGKEELRLMVNLCRLLLRDRYTGSLLGVYWTVINPLIQLAVYTFVFAFILKSKIPGAESTFHFVLWLFGGLVPWLAVTESLSLAANSVVSSSGLLKNMVFKSECLPIVGVLMGLIPFLVGLLVIGILLVMDGNLPGGSITFLPLLVLLQLLLLTGLGFFLSAASVFVRDITSFLGSVLMIFFFATPIFYSIEMMPAWARHITFFNPFYQLVDAYRHILIDHGALNLAGLLYLVLLAVVLNIFGLRFFRFAKDYFESAL